MKTTIIAEAGVNHNGNHDFALRLVEVAAKAGADYVKFQTFITEELVSEDAMLADYQKTNLEGAQKKQNQFQMLKQLELTADMHHVLYEKCRQEGIRFLSTAFDMPSLDFLCELGVDYLKIPSGEITNYPFLKKIASKGVPVILSTGMSTMEDVEAAFHLLVTSGVPKDQVTILHCNSAYPTPFSDVNLNAMLSMQKKFGAAVGYSDHTTSLEVAVAAVAMGATMIEKHFTLDKTLPGPDHQASLNPDELRTFVSYIRNTEMSLGSAEKIPTASETVNRIPGRKSIFLSRAVEAGEIINDTMLTTRRPGDGISPMAWQQVAGKTTARALPAGHKLQWEDLQ